MIFLENEIKKIIYYEGLSYLNVEDNGEGSLFGASIDYIDTLIFNKEQYEQWEDLLDSIDIIRDNFQIYCSWDRSGYDFWNNHNESNHTYIDIWISDDFSDEDITPLFNEVDKIINKIDNFYFSIKN
jgi:hypothetical protein